MNFLTDMLWMAGAALSLGFLAYGGFLLLFLPVSKQARATPRTARLHLAS